MEISLEYTWKCGRLGQKQRDINWHSSKEMDMVEFLLSIRAWDECVWTGGWNGGPNGWAGVLGLIANGTINGTLDKYSYRPGRYSAFRSSLPVLYSKVRSLFFLPFHHLPSWGYIFRCSFNRRWINVHWFRCLSCSNPHSLRRLNDYCHTHWEISIHSSIGNYE